MLGAEAVIAGTLGAVTELKLRIGCIRAAADAAFAVITLRLLRGLLLMLLGTHGVVEMCGLSGLMMLEL